MRRTRRRDENEPDLVRLARQLGAVMWLLDEPVDWLCGWRGSWYPTEIKNVHGRNRLTSPQELFLATAKERALPVWIWRSQADVLRDLDASIGT
jgi:hypothetical protein